MESALLPIYHLTQNSGSVRKRWFVDRLLDRNDEATRTGHVDARLRRTTNSTLEHHPAYTRRQLHRVSSFVPSARHKHLPPNNSPPSTPTVRHDSVPWIIQSVRLFVPHFPFRLILLFCDYAWGVSMFPSLLIIISCLRPHIALNHALTKLLSLNRQTTTNIY